MSRNYSIIRKPDMPDDFDWNSVNVRYVGTCPETGFSLYCSPRTGYAVRVAPDGTKKLLNPRLNWYNGAKHFSKKERSYLLYDDAFGRGKKIYVAHAVWMAAGYTFTPGKHIDHINGDHSINGIHNLRLVTPEINYRDGGFLMKLRNNGYDPTRMSKEHLLRYYNRMAKIKETITDYRYKRLTRGDLWWIVYTDATTLTRYLNNRFGNLFNLNN